MTDALFDSTARGVLIGLTGLTLKIEEAALLKSPATAGCVLFARNYQSRTQLQTLVKEIRSQRNQPLIIAVDQEGGRVQRFRDEFSILPPLGQLGLIEDEALALAMARAHARLMALEVMAAGVDMSLAPVLDVDGGCEVIGDRAFARQNDRVSRMGVAYVQAMQEAGMSACGKHFPGHGCVVGDSHLVRPLDHRSIQEIRRIDLPSFAAAIGVGIHSIMMSHVVHDALDVQPAGYSSRWIDEVLRGELGFAGVVMSDDLAMQGATTEKSVADRVRVGFEAGCNLMLACQPEDSEEAVEAATKASTNTGAIVSFLAASASARACQAQVTAARGEFHSLWPETS